MGVHRSAIRERDRLDAIATKAVNSVRKDKERVRRDARLIAKIKAGSLPYGPAIMSWASRQLGKPASRITQDEIHTLVG